MNKFLKRGGAFLLGLIAYFYVEVYIQEVYYLPCTMWGVPFWYMYIPMLLLMIPLACWCMGFYLLIGGD